MALKLYEYEEIRDAEEHITHFLLIEEPEAHIHNHIQKTLFDNFNFQNTQVFVSTHSTQISSVSKISSMNILARQRGYTDIYQPSNGLQPKEISSIERYLDAIRSDVLFAKSVILVEGDAELIIIPELIKVTLGISLDELGISLIKLDGTVFKHISNLFHSNRLKRYCAILTDKDLAYVKEPDELFDADFVESLKNAEIDGLRRERELAEYVEGNEFVSVFYAENTFETELVRYDENSDLFNSVIRTTYKRSGDIERVVAGIKSDDLRVRFRTARFFANKIGKGWLATEMVEYLHNENRVPDYILKAIHFALKDRELNAVLNKMLAYNMSLMGTCWDGVCNKINSESDFDKKMQEYSKHFDDSFSRFWEL